MIKSVLSGELDFSYFQYVVERLKPQQICFGSKLPRTTGFTGTGLSPFQRKFTQESNPKVGPLTYDISKIKSALESDRKVRSIKGVGGLADATPRFDYIKIVRTPSVTRYDAEPFIKQHIKIEHPPAPFGMTGGRFSTKYKKVPGPGLYQLIARKCRRPRFAHNFGRPPPTPIHAVEVICVGTPTDTCDLCTKVIKGPEDYWHYNYTNYLCFQCMKEEKIRHDLFKAEHLKRFLRIRNCSFMHDHQDTTAAIRIQTQSQIKRRSRKEDYLDKFFDPRK